MGWAILLIGPSACAASVGAASFPPSADLRVEPKPELSVEAVASGSDAALALHDDAVEAWGERGWAAVARICRWAVTNGAELPFKCPPPDS